MSIPSRLLEEVVDDFARTSRYTGLSAPDPRVLQAMERLERTEFIPSSWSHLADENRAVAIGLGQTISQPFIVALMTSLLELSGEETVLEIGTGSGYQAAVLARLAARVYSIEILPELARSAEDRLRRMRIDNVEVRCGDGWSGWPEHAPYAGILVTACTPVVPPALTDQLAAGGRMVVPLGETQGPQDLALVVREPDSGLRRRSVLPVSFVPLTGRVEGSRSRDPEHR